MEDYDPSATASLLQLSTTKFTHIGIRGMPYANDVMLKTMRKDVSMQEMAKNIAGNFYWENADIAKKVLNLLIDAKAVWDKSSDDPAKKSTIGLYNAASMVGLRKQRNAAHESTIELSSFFKEHNMNRDMIRLSRVLDFVFIRQNEHDRLIVAKLSDKMPPGSKLPIEMIDHICKFFPRELGNQLSPLTHLNSDLQFVFATLNKIALTL